MNHLRVPLMMLTSPAMMAIIQARCWKAVLTISRLVRFSRVETSPVKAAPTEVKPAREELMFSRCRRGMDFGGGCSKVNVKA